MENEDLYKSALADYLYYCIANINKESTRLKCVDTPKDGKTQRNINNVSKMLGTKRIKLSEGTTIHIQNELVLALKELED